MNSFESFFHGELQALIEAERKDRLAGLAKQVDYNEYLVRVGYLRALQWVEDACVEVERKLKAPMSNKG